MKTYSDRYNQLNPQQQQAVDTIEGPVLVVAGPGSGKTELLGLRTANILRQVDLEPHNILCLTFTESAAFNLRQRLAGLIGAAAYRTAIYTFHSFGTEIINRYPEHFYQGANFRAADELTQLEILQEIFSGLGPSNPISSQHPEQGYVYLKPTQRAIEDLKKAGLSPDEFLQVIDHNAASLEKVAELVDKTFSERLTAKNFSQIQELITALESAETDFPVAHFSPLLPTIAASLQQALAAAGETNKAAPLSAWKSKYTKKTSSGQRVLKDQLYLEHLRSLQQVYQAYRQQMYRRGYFDFQDMLLDVIAALQTNGGLKQELQEQYQYIMVDEFQDTNDAQMRLLGLLTDNPVHEGRPNVMAVGDDDQAIFKFQGAEISNILDFRGRYRQPQLITLTDSYRSSQEILNLASNVIQRGNLRLENIIAEIDKNLTATNKTTGGDIHQHDFSDSAAEYSFIAQEVKKLLEQKTPPQEIAVIARRHQDLENLAPYFHQLQIPVHYDRQQNVLEEPHIHQLVQLARFTQSLVDQSRPEADELLPEILSYPFWEVDRKTIWQLSVEAKRTKRGWLELCLEHSNEKIKNIAQSFLDLAAAAHYQPAEHILDGLIGNEQHLERNSQSFISPFRQFYFGSDKLAANQGQYLDFLSALKTFVAALREYRSGQRLKISDLLNFVETHNANNLPVTSHRAASDDQSAVNLLTAHKAKGLEFGTVFVLSCQENIWASSHRRHLLPFPQNLPITPAGDDLDDQLRLFYVAITRAKHNLYLTSHQQDSRGRQVSRLHFLPDLGAAKSIKPIKLPELSLASRHQPPFAPTETNLLQTLVENYQLTVTDLNHFLDIPHGGPQALLENRLLGFPRARSANVAYGIASHDAIRFLYLDLKKTGQLPTLEKFLSYFGGRLKSQPISEQEIEFYLEKGQASLSTYYKNKKGHFKADHQIEFDFQNQGVLVADTPLSGKIDKLEVMSEKEIKVYDFKTGQSASDWKRLSPKLVNYRRQLIFYKLLVENSNQFKNYKVNTGVLEYIDPQDEKTVELSLEIEAAEVERLTKLITIIYGKIKNLDFPDVSGYSPDLKGILQFEEDLLNGRV